MDYIALTGPIKSGKTAVARALRDKHAFTLVSYTDLLKEYVARALSGAGFPTTLEDILANKEFYRALIQEFGTVIGFDNGGEFIEEALEEVSTHPHAKVVFDNVRTDEQAEAMRAWGYGFTIVRLDATYPTRYFRIENEGDDPVEVLERGSHQIERGVSEELIDLSISTDIGTPEMIADFLATLKLSPYTFDGHPDDAREFERLANEETTNGN